MKTVLLVFGTRPEAIKLAPVVRRFKERHDRITTVVAVTGQHREMLDQVLGLFRIIPDFDLDLMRHGQRPEEVLSGAVTGIASLVREVGPDAVLVQGDTTTTLAGALAGFYEHAFVGHVEAGLRTGDKRAPFPEEANRRLTTQVSDWHFAPTDRARAHLLAEGISADDVFVTGNTVIDAVLEASAMECVFDDDRLGALAAGTAPFMLMTAHRRESWGEPMRHICEGVRDVLEAHPEMVLVFPLHRNPIVRDAARVVLGDHPRAILTEPLDYLPFVKLMGAATLILSDSGGVQEEAPSLDTPVLVLRETTERPEALESGATALVGVERQAIAAAALRLLDDEDAYRRMARAKNPFGDGTAAQQIADIVESRLC